MGDFRIQKEINNATKDCLIVLNDARKKEMTISKNALLIELLSKYALTPLSAKRIVDICIQGNFDEIGDQLVPKKV